MSVTLINIDELIGKNVLKLIINDTEYVVQEICMKDYLNYLSSAESGNTEALEKMLIGIGLPETLVAGIGIRAFREIMKAVFQWLSRSEDGGGKESANP